MNDPISRRRAAGLIGAAAAGAIVPFGGSGLLAAEKPGTKGDKPERGQRITRAIPSTGEKLPVIGLGSALTFDVPSHSSQAQSIAEVISLFVTHGGKLIDTSPAYGNAESLIGELAFKSGLRSSLFL